MGKAFACEIVKKAFKDNGQIDNTEGVVPDIDGLVGTYRGNLDVDHYLKKTKEIIDLFYKEVFKNGRVDESSFDKADVVQDKDSRGKVVSRDFGIQKENCQQAKTLSALAQ